MNRRQNFFLQLSSLLEWGGEERNGRIAPTPLYSASGDEVAANVAEANDLGHVSRYFIAPCRMKQDKGPGPLR